jgi:P27 family predicted phage terminase small subunit
VTTQEPQHPPLDLAHVPPEISHCPEAIREWERVTPQLVATRHVTVVDRALVVAYCLKYGQWVALESRAREARPTIERANGSTMINPLIALCNDACQLMIRSATELGITPSSRSRVAAVAPPPPVSKWAGALK